MERGKEKGRRRKRSVGKISEREHSGRKIRRKKQEGKRSTEFKK